MAAVFKRNVFLRKLIFILTLGFVTVFSTAFAADNLRPRSASQGRVRDIVNALEGTTRKDGGEVVKEDLTQRLVVRFNEIRKTDVPIAGGKGANLGELQHVKGISVPDGVAVTTKAFKIHINKGTVDFQGKKISLKDFIDIRLKDLNYEDTIALNTAAQEIRDAIETAEMPQEIKDDIAKWYQKLCDETGIKNVPVAVRSSATAEDMEGAAFAGQQDTYLNMRGIEEVLDAVKRDWASLFTARSIFYRHNIGIAHDVAFLSAVIQLMIESKVAGTTFGVDLNTGMPAVEVDSGWGLGEGIVSGTVTGDHYKLVYDHKTGQPKLLQKTLGSKLKKFIYKQEHGLKAKEGTDLVDTTPAERKKFTLTKKQAVMIAKAQQAINNHYGMYMDVEWAIDSRGNLWILQARPETIWNEQEKEYPDTVVTIVSEVPEAAAETAKVLFSGNKGARRAGFGKVVIVKSEEKATPTETAVALAQELSRVQQGDIMVTKMTKPDMVPAMKRSAAIVTDEGGPTCHAAIVARELRIPCMVGTSTATKILKEGQVITVDANRGKIYDGQLEIVKRKELESIPDLPVTEKTQLGIINSEPDLAMEIWQFSKYPSYGGYGLFRKEFVDTTEILSHPLAGLDYDRYNDPKFKDEAKRKWIKENVIDTFGDEIKTTIEGYPSYKDFYIDKLSVAIVKVASAQTKGQRVKYRTTDFKTNEYSNQIGASPYEPKENNPMMGYRGIFRMMHPNYIEAFKLELQAIKQARKIQSNVDIMFPVVRTVEELEAAVELMAEEGIFEGKDKPYIGMMVEVPADIFQADEFYAKLKELADKHGTKAFMSIGSNDLTQFTLGLGRDNDKMDKFFNEADPAVKKALEIVIKTAKKYGIFTGLCGQRPSNDNAFAAFLSSVGIDSISVVPDVYGNVVRVVAKAEAEQAGKPFDPNIAGWELPSTSGNPQVITASEVKAADIISAINLHPTALLEDYSKGNKRVKDLVINAVYQAIMDKVKVTAKDATIIYTTDDQDRTGYEKLPDGKKYEAAIQEMDENPQLGFLGLARVVDPEFQEFFRWQIEGVKKARQESGRNIGIKFSTPTNLGNVRDALALLKAEGLVPGQDGLMVGMEIAKPANVLLLNEFISLGINFLSENNARLVSYIMALDPGSEFVNYSDTLKEKALANPRRIWTTFAEKNNIPMVKADGGAVKTRQALSELVKQLKTADESVFNGLSAGFGNFVNSLRGLENSPAALLIGANTVFENAGTLTALKKIKAGQPGLKIAFWAKDKAEAEKLKTVIADSLADSSTYESLSEALKSLKGFNIVKERTVLVNSDLDNKNIKEEFRVQDMKEFLSMPGFNGLRIVAVHETSAFVKGESINNMPLVLARATAAAYQDEQVVKQYEKLSANSGLSEDTLKALNDLDQEFATVPLVKVSEDIAEAQDNYEKTIRETESKI